MRASLLLLSKSAAFFILLFLGLVLVFSSGARAQMQRALGVDETGFKQPVPAFSVIVPQSWQPKGGVFWGSQDPCNRYGYEMSWAALSPDERYGVAILPAMRWIASPQQSSGLPQCAVLQIGSVRDAIAIMVGRMNPKAQIIDYRQRPDFIQEAGLQPSHFDLGQGAWMKTHVDAGEALFSFLDDQGRPMRMTVGLALVVHETFMPGGGVMPDMRMMQGETLPAWLAFAPDGELDTNFSEKMRRSIEMNPEWHNRIMQHHAKINGDNRRTQANISQINRETNDYISRLSREGHENRMRAMDRTSEAFSHVINDREVWRDTDGSRLNAPIGGENLWRLDNGDYVSTDDYNFNPLEQTGQFGTQLERWDQ